MTSSYSLPSRTLFLLLVGAGIVACGDASPSAHTQQDNQTEPTGSPSSNGTPSTEGAANGDVGAAKSAASGKCLDVAGTWEGPVTGLAKADPRDADPSQEVDGSANLTFVPAEEAGNFTIVDGQFDVEINMGGLLGKVRAKQTITGEAKCGKLEAIASGNGLLGKLSGTATCSFENGACKGDWIVNDKNGELAARGTFEIKK